MTTHNTREGIEEILKQLDSLMRQAVEWQDTGAVYAYEKAKDVVRSVETTFHQELQKAREEERKKVLWNIGAMVEEADFARKVAERTGEALPTLEVQAVIKQVQIMLDRYQSELDQPNK